MNDPIIYYSQEVARAATLLFTLMDASYRHSKEAIRVSIQGHTYGILHFQEDLRSRLLSLSGAGEKAAGLMMSVLEDTYRSVRELLLVRMCDLLEGDGLNLLSQARELEQLFRENVYKELWQEKAEHYVSLMTSMGFCGLTAEDYLDLTDLLDPLMDAFCYYRNHKLSILQPYQGARSSASGKVHILTDVALFSSQKEFADAVFSLPQERVIAFGGVVLTNRATDDYFYQFLNGHYEARHENWVRRNQRDWLHGRTPQDDEAYWEETASPSIWLCVKDLENLYLCEMPYEQPGTRVETMADRYYYGRRLGYLPFEVFLKDRPFEAETCTSLSIPRLGYPLSKLMDRQQAAWLPAFLDETVHAFFEEGVQAKACYFPEEQCFCIGEAALSQPNGRLLPSVSRSISWDVQEPSAYAETDTERRLFQWAGLTKEALSTVPLALPYELYSSSEFEQRAKACTAHAYRFLLAMRISQYLQEQIWKVRPLILSRIAAHKEEILSHAMDGSFDDFLRVIIHNRPMLDEDGKPISLLVPGQGYTDRERVTAADLQYHRTDGYASLSKTLEPIKYRYGKEGKASVLLKLRPSSASDYRKLLCLAEEEALFEVLSLADDFHRFFAAYPHLGNRFSDRFPSSWDQNTEELCYHMPGVADLNLFMTKTAFRDYKGMKTNAPYSV